MIVKNYLPAARNSTTVHVRAVDQGADVITGSKVPRPTKERLANDAADALGIAHATMSPQGGTVVSTFLDDLHRAMYGTSTGGVDTYRKAERLLQSLGLTYDPYWDTSEAANWGGGTVTARTYSRIRSALLDTPRCFILNVTDAPVGSKWETDHTSVYRYDATVTGRQPFNDAGPGSRVLYYSTSKSTTNKKHFVGHAEVKYIANNWDPPWEAQLTGYTEFETPVSIDDVAITGWNRQHAITEIDWLTYEAIVVAGGVSPELDVASETPDPGGDVVAERVAKDFPATVPAIHVPTELPLGELPLRPPQIPEYKEAANGRGVVGGPSMPPRSPSDRKKDKVAELRAVEVAIRGLEGDGWTYSADRQKDGVGYDLEFTRAGTTLKVEVKGIQGSHLVFNLTPKEAWRAETDPDWVVVAVTSVLSPSAYTPHLISRDRIAAASRVVTGFRLTL
ncbi:DUF3883 domain-containing protein [Nocardioides agariphilus]|uniref:DUF3883 domain-containing protein n=1 Tax=Nocardioides agariphilus TaxID=433664 RepID=A0A930VHB7_9ACTN|nr:DUF3883 domain-containing protein [Nocardioides agariphilus]MBF4766607.1 DUF3883 domain-containing protein [Nocardioides agariphilus]